MEVYRVKSLRNQKVYIGKCSTTAKERWQTHQMITVAEVKW